METTLRIAIRLTVVALMPLAAACVQGASLQPIKPERIGFAGDTARFGPGVTAIEPAGRYLQLELRERATVVFLKYSRLTGVVQLDVRQLEAGVQRVSPQRVGARTSCSRRCTEQQRQSLQSVRAPYEGLLVVVTIADKENDPLRGNNGEYWVPPNRLIDANVALHDLPPSMMRSAVQPWAAYLVNMEP